MHSLPAFARRQQNETATRLPVPVVNLGTAGTIGNWQWSQLSRVAHNWPSANLIEAWGPPRHT